MGGGFFVPRSLNPAAERAAISSELRRFNYRLAPHPKPRQIRSLAHVGFRLCVHKGLKVEEDARAKWQI